MKALVISLVVALMAMCNSAVELPEGVCFYSSDSRYISIGDKADSASVAELFGEPQRVVRFTDDEALCGEVERIVYDSAVVVLLDGVVYEFSAWYEGARVSVNGDLVAVGMARADLKVGTEPRHRYFAERNCGYVHLEIVDLEITDGTQTKDAQMCIVEDCLIYMIVNERVTSVGWHVPI